jgi:hypothetical protein
MHVEEGLLGGISAVLVPALAATHSRGRWTRGT